MNTILNFLLLLLRFLLLLNEWLIEWMNKLVKNKTAKLRVDWIGLDWIGSFLHQPSSETWMRSLEKPLKMWLSFRGLLSIGWVLFTLIDHTNRPKKEKKSRENQAKVSLFFVCLFVEIAGFDFSETLRVVSFSILKLVFLSVGNFCSRSANPRRHVRRRDEEEEEEELDNVNQLIKQSKRSHE